MATHSVHSTSDPAVALDVGGPFLLTQPEHNSIALSTLSERAAHSEEGRYWWACLGGEVVAFAMHSSKGFRAVVAPAEPPAVAALVDGMAEEGPDLPGVMGDAATAAAFAGRWAEVRIVPARPVEALRLHRIHAVRHPEGVPGVLRLAVPAERPVLLEWAAAFLRDTELDALDPAQVVDRRMGAGRLWLWDVDGDPVSMAGLSAPAGGVARVGFVYTSPEQRRRGFAAACVAAVSERVLAEGAGCILHTQLHNPTSNGVYRRLGYVPVAEILLYRFG